MSILCELAIVASCVDRQMVMEAIVNGYNHLFQRRSVQGIMRVRKRGGKQREQVEAIKESQVA